MRAGEGHRRRSALAGDPAEVAGLIDRAYRHYVERLGRPPVPMSEDYSEVIRRRDVTVVEAQEGIVAVIVLGVTEEGFTIDNIAVDPSHQGEGLGRGLLEFAEEEARRRGFDAIHLYTHERMTENRALYGRIGYREYARRREAGHARVLMRKQLARGAGRQEKRSRP